MIQAKQLSKTYGNTEAVRQLNLHVQAGEIFCLLGPNGAGKTTTINLFLGFEQPSSGTASVNGNEVGEKLQQVRRDIAYIPEQLMLYPQLTGLQNLQYFTALSGNTFSKAELENFLLEVDLSQEAIHRKTKTYSKGMRQKVGIAMAVAKQAKVLLLDEPTSGLDPKASHEFATLIRKLGAAGTAILMTTHDLFRAKETATTIGIMRSGDLVTVLPAAQLTHRELENNYLEAIAVA